MTTRGGIVSDILTIVPSSVELRAGDSQVFEARDQNGQAVSGVTWSLPENSVGTIGANDGTYTAPSPVYGGRRLAVLARKVDTNGTVTAQGSATIDLDSTRSWVPLFGGLWIALFVALVTLLLVFWTELCPQCSLPRLQISPPVVTLTRGQAQQFVASAAATWTNTVNAAGLYIAPSAIDGEQSVTVTATSESDPRQSATAVVRQSPAAGLAVLPPRVMVKAGEQVRLTAAATGSDVSPPTWLAPSAGTITAEGVFTAPRDSRTQSITVLAQAQTTSTPPSMLVAGSLVTVTPEVPSPCEPDVQLWRIILLVAWVGAIGGLTHAMGSFGTYVGNRELKASWLWWYALRPPLSAAVAVLVFLVFRAGLGAPDLGLGAGDCLKVAGFAGLVGLFAEPATVKLKDVFEAIFTPRRDPREDRAGQTTTGAAVPEIASVDPKQISTAAGGTLRVTGRNFAESCVVSIGKTAFTPKRISSTELHVAIDAQKLTPGKHALAVINKPSGEGSKPEEITVTA
jgi:hypothetical protein